jgi:DNA replication protein DnaC
MLIHQTAEKLKTMRLGAMAELLLNQESQTAAAQLSFEERLGLLVDYEWTSRQNKKLQRLLKNARLKINACLEDIDYQHPRKLDQKLMVHLGSMKWLLAHQNVLLSGPTGVGKTYLVCALGNQACRHGFSVRYFKMSKLTAAIAAGKADGSLPQFLDRLAKINLLIIDDFGLAPLTAEQGHDFLDIIDDRLERGSTVMASQLPVEHWHQLLGDPTVADAVLDRLVHRAHRLALSGETMRKA